MGMDRNNGNKLSKSLYKTSLDFLKVLVFRAAMDGSFNGYFQNTLQTQGYNLSDLLSGYGFGNMYFLNDIVAADKSALFIPGSVINEVPESFVFKEFFYLYIRTNQLLNTAIIPTTNIPLNRSVKYNDGTIVNPPQPNNILNRGAFGKKKKYFKIANMDFGKNNKIKANKKKVDKNTLFAASGNIISEVSMGFGKKNKTFIQEANKKSRKKGTVGTFGRWCKSHGLATADGKVTRRCINKAKKSGNTTLIRRAVFAQNIGGYAGAVKYNSFGMNLKNIEKYLHSL